MPDASGDAGRECAACGGRGKGGPCTIGDECARCLGTGTYTTHMQIRDLELARYQALTAVVRKFVTGRANRAELDAAYLRFRRPHRVG